MTGEEQPISTATVPSDIAVFFTSGGGSKPAKWQTVADGAPHGYRVADGTPFVIDDLYTIDRNLPSNAVDDPNGDRGSCSFYDGTLPVGGQGYGIESICVPLADIAAGTMHGVFLFPDFPTPAHDTVVWSHLPAGAAFVTLSGDGVGPLWQRPVNGVAGFTVPVSTAYTGDNFTTAPRPALRAYDGDGNVLAQVTSPYLVNFITGVAGT